MMDLKQNTKQKRIIISIFDQFADGYDNPAQRCFPFFADQLVTEWCRSYCRRSSNRA